MDSTSRPLAMPVLAYKYARAGVDTQADQKLQAFATECQPSGLRPHPTMPQCLTSYLARDNTPHVCIRPKGHTGRHFSKQPSRKQRNYALATRVLNGRRTLTEVVADVEREAIMEAMKAAGWNQTRATALLGITRRMLGYKIKQLGIDMPCPRCGRSGHVDDPTAND